MSQFRRAALKGLSAAIRRVNRNPWTNLTLELVERGSYQHDGLWTAHNHMFLEEPAFQRAYQRAISASGWDYEIYWRIHVLLWAARTAESVAGAFVECGTGRGFTASAICEYLNWSDRPFCLFDTFEAGLVTPDTPGRGPAVAHYANGPEAVRGNFREWPGVTIVVGEVPDSLSTVDVEAVAFLHIDMNNPIPEEAAVRHFWPRLSPGAIVVFDDYAYRGYDASHDAANRLASELGFSILSLPTGQGLVVKPGDALTGNLDAVSRARSSRNT